MQKGTENTNNVSEHWTNLEQHAVKGFIRVFVLLKAIIFHPSLQQFIYYKIIDVVMHFSFSIC